MNTFVNLHSKFEYWCAMQYSEIHSHVEDFWIGLLVGCVFISKQSIGICLFISMILFFSHRCKKISSFLFPCLLVLIYLIYYDIIYQFVDYVFLGLFDFGGSNHLFSYLYFIIFLFQFLFLLVKILGSKFKDKAAIMAFTFQCVCFPIFDGGNCPIK